MLNNKYPFKLPPLPYAYDGLEPYIDQETVHIHHDKHFAAYVDNLNKVLANHPNLQKLTLRDLLTKPLELSAESDKVAIMRNGGGVYNHDLYFKGIGPKRGLGLQDYREQIYNQFGEIDGLKKEFNEKAMSVFGSGWTYLIVDGSCKLEIVNTRNQETPLDIGTPILICDVWEHAYYLKYKNLRKDYIDAWWNLLSKKSTKHFDYTWKL